MAESVGLNVVALATEKLISTLCELKASKAFGGVLVLASEVDLFVSCLIENMELIKKKLTDGSSPWAIESLRNDLEKLTVYLETCARKGYFVALVDANKFKAELETIRRNLVSAFQVKLVIATLEVAIGGEKKVGSFQSKMLEFAAADSNVSRFGVGEFLRPLVLGMGKTDESLQPVIAMLRGLSEQSRFLDLSAEARKFMTEVLANLEQPAEQKKKEYVVDDSSDEDLDQYNDPLTFDLMCDPVKCTDGRTYDRWTIIDNNLTRSPFGQRKNKPFVIAFDDVDVRARLFQKFQKEGVEAKYRSKRAAYREKALALAREGEHSEALKMLDHVLEWTDADQECEDMRQRMKDAVDNVLPAPAWNQGRTSLHQELIAWSRSGFDIPALTDQSSVLHRSATARAGLVQLGQSNTTSAEQTQSHRSLAFDHQMLVLPIGATPGAYDGRRLEFMKRALDRSPDSPIPLSRWSSRVTPNQVSASESDLSSLHGNSGPRPGLMTRSSSGDERGLRREVDSDVELSPQSDDNLATSAGAQGESQRLTYLRQALDRSLDSPFPVSKWAINPARRVHAATSSDTDQVRSIHRHGSSRRLWVQTSSGELHERGRQRRDVEPSDSRALPVDPSPRPTTHGERLEYLKKALERAPDSCLPVSKWSTIASASGTQPGSPSETRSSSPTEEEELRSRISIWSPIRQ